MSGRAQILSKERIHTLVCIVLLSIVIHTHLLYAQCSGRSKSDCDSERSDARERYNRFFDALSSRRKSNVHNGHKMEGHHRRNRKRSALDSSPTRYRTSPVRYNQLPAAVKPAKSNNRHVSALTTVYRNRLAEERQVALLKLRQRVMQSRQYNMLRRMEIQNQKPWWGVWSTWSACGRTCGSGVQFRERHCLGSGFVATHRNGKVICEGPTKRYQICNTNPCPKDTPNFRKLQCSQYAADMVRGGYYTWKPYGHPVDEVASNEPCQLVCVSNIDEIQINTIAMDGTECHQGWNSGRCVEGKCRLIGCDGLIGSKYLRNKCGNCDGNGTSCAVYDEIFTRAFPSKGEYQVVRIPKGAYNILVIERRKTSANIVVKSSNGNVLFNEGGRLSSGRGSEGWPSNIFIAGTEFRYRKPIVLSSTSGFEYILGSGPINETIVVYLSAMKPGLGILHYEFKVPITEAKPVTDGPTTSTMSTQGSTDATGPEENSTLQSYEIGLEVDREEDSKIAEDDMTETTTIHTNSVVTMPSISIAEPVLISKKPKIVFKPEWNGKEINENVDAEGEPTLRYTFISKENEHGVNINGEDEEDFLLQREIETTPGDGRKKVVHSEDNGREFNSSASFPVTQHNETFLLKPPVQPIHPISILSGQDDSSKYIRLDESNETNLIARVYTVEKHINEGNETTDTDVVDDDNPKDGDEDYIVPGVDVQVPVRYGSRYGSRYSQTSSIYGWRTNGFAPCSSTCTSGLQDSYAVCERLRDNLQVDDSYCPPTTRPDPVRRSCLNKPCAPRWEVTPWSECSMSCGDGVQMRTARCWKMISTGFDSTVYTERCDGVEQEKPKETKPCRVMDHCGPMWETSDWSNCPAPCGQIGVKWRTVRCSAGRDYLCAQKPRPFIEEECMGPKCVLKWTTSVWGPCSGVCGGGRKTRNVICTDRIGNVRPQYQCDPQLKPATSHPCGDVNCRPEWIAQQWKECSVECGAGTRTRTVLCSGIIEGEVHHYEDDTPCNPATKPEVSESCKMRDCDPVWFTTPWSKCSVTCGNGQRVREVKCYLKSAPAEGCNESKKPAHREACVMPACPQPRAEQCKDKTTVNCSLVKKVRLCSHWYYRKACCNTCQSGTSPRGRP